MKKKVFASLLTAICLCGTTPVFAQTDSEILFRDIPWGTSYADAKNILSDFDWYGLSFENMKTYPVLEAQNVIPYNKIISQDGTISEAEMKC